jgi:hypothetical protein
MHLTIRCIFDKKGHLPDNRVSKDLVVQWWPCYRIRGCKCSLLDVRHRYRNFLEVLAIGCNVIGWPGYRRYQCMFIIFCDFALSWSLKGDVLVVKSFVSLEKCNDWSDRACLSPNSGRKAYGEGKDPSKPPSVMGVGTYMTASERCCVRRGLSVRLMEQRCFCW